MNRLLLPLPALALLCVPALADPPAASTKGHSPARTEAATPSPARDSGDARVSTIATGQITGFADFPANVQALIRDGLTLTRRKLDYKYGSAHPDNGGMDCSGTIYYLLRQSGVPNVPRQANTMYKWVWQNTGIHAVASSNPQTFELADLQPGDLLFWSGTYDVKRDPPITHVMLYLGRKQGTGQRLMLGASSGRRYEGKPRNGVSVFDFVLPKPNADGSGPRFVGYGRVPNLPAVAATQPAPEETPKPASDETIPPDAKPGGPAVILNSESAPPKAKAVDPS